MEVLNPETNKPFTNRYAGFWLRFVAFILDSVLVGVIDFIILFMFFGIHIFRIHNLTPHSFPFGTLAHLFPVIIISVIIKWLYFAGMESSKHQATPGKMALDVKVTDLQGNRISFAKATGRYFGKILSSLIFYIGYLMAAFTEKKQALHDKLADTVVLRS
ncbi:MAG: RDD family protein [Bacteroidia bacterium]